MRKIAVYCSGSASRIIKFYNNNLFTNFPISFIYYDGYDLNIVNTLNQIHPDLKIFTLEGIKLENNSNKNFSDILLKKLCAFKIDYLFCFGTRILKGDLLLKYKNRIVNFHPSLLPSFKGLNAIDRALNTSVQFLGNTAHFISEEIDSGPIIMQIVIRRNMYNSYDDILDLQLILYSKIYILLQNDEIKVNSKGVVIFNKVDLSKTYYLSHD
jgi:phosphoribosylglycinamide formyltransferase-1